jgi:hypothetical protein
VPVNSAATTTRSSATSEPPSLTTGRAAAPPPEARKTSARTTAATNVGDLMAEDDADRCNEFVGCIAAPNVCGHEQMKSSCIAASCAPCIKTHKNTSRGRHVLRCDLTLEMEWPSSRGRGENLALI